MSLALDPKLVRLWAARLALAMLVADLAGRARVLAETQETSGKSFRPAKGLSFGEPLPVAGCPLTEIEFVGGRGGCADGRATSAAPATFNPLCERAAESAGGGGGTHVRRARANQGSTPIRLTEFADAVVLAPEKLEPKAALDFFRQKTAMTRAAFDRLGKRYRDAAFTVANVESVKLIEEIQAELDKALAEGLTRQQFAKAVDARFRARGLQPLDPFHLETVWRTNVASAYSAGRASQMLQPDVRRALPYWQYHTVGDSRVRDEHAALDGFIARWDDSVWSKIYPPNGYNCRCKVTAITAAQARELAAASGQDLGKPGIERLPEGAHIDFDNSPAVSLAARAEGEAPPSSSAPRLSAKQVTERALALREKAMETYAPLAADLERRMDVVLDGGLSGRRLDEARVAVIEAARKLRPVKAAFDARVHELARPAAPRRYELEVHGAATAEQRATWERGLRAAGRLIGVGPSRAIVTVEASRGRSQYSPSQRRLRMRASAGERKVVHEMGHWLEHSAPAVAAASQAFLARRTRGERAVQLRQLFPKRRYRIDELTKEDEFLSAYMGKIYATGETEIVSMGLEWLFDQPFELLGDADYFEFLLGVLRGEGL